MWTGEARLERWEALIARWRAARRPVEIAVVGKYVHLADTYKSLNEALSHGGVASDAKVTIRFVDSEQIDLKDPGALLKGCDGVLVPGGFGERGVEGKIAAIRWAREGDVPFFGICLGMQLAVIEFARNVLGWHDAHSREFSQDSSHLVIQLMDAQRRVAELGGTMRLGAYPCALRDGSRAARIYGHTTIQERHRHRFEVDPSVFEALEAAGMLVVGRSPDGRLAEVVELKDHRFFLACQYHPEFKSRPLDPHPLFRSFVAAALERRERS
jgi:CTP synthase